MATITLYKRELEEGGLPPFCMCCGEPATRIKPKRFSWGPAWVMALVVIGPIVSGPLILVGLILIPFLLKRMWVPVPLCEKHRHHWLALQVVLYGGIAVLALLFFLTILFFFMGRGPGDTRNQWAVWFGLTTLGFLIGLLFPAAVLQKRVIRPTEITPHSITLARVDKRFVQRVKEKRGEPAQVQFDEF
jgi:hypothetical protein